MKGKLRSRALFLALVLMASASQSYAGIPSYRFTDLGTLGGTESAANAINNAGVVAGWARTAAGHAHATVWNGAKATDLGTLGGIYSMANDINDLGQVVGEAYTTSNTASYATLWTGTKATHLGTLNVAQSSANAINNGGQVVGWAQTLEEVSDYATHATSWSGAKTTVLGSPGGLSSAEDINDAGQIVGSDGFMATLCNGTTATQLGSYFSSASAINSSGQVAGVEPIYVDPIFPLTDRSVVWNTFDEMRTTTMEGMDNPLAMNDSGQVVGSSTFDAILWTDGNVINLNRFLDDSLVNQGWNLTKATGINNNGWIVGEAVNQQSNLTHAFLLTPIPEADTYIMFVAGLGLLGFMARSRKA